MDNFFMIYVDGERGSTTKHEIFEAAKEEAYRLAHQYANIGKKVYILKSWVAIETAIAAHERLLI